MTLVDYQRWLAGQREFQASRVPMCSLLGNHDLRLRRTLLGEAHRVAAETAATAASLSPAQRARAAVEKHWSWAGVAERLLQPFN